MFDNSRAIEYPCEFIFSIVSLPTDRQFYSFELGNRGKITFSRSELEATGWHVGLVLGDEPD